MPVTLWSQAATYTTGTVLSFGGTLPATCNVGELYAKNTATVGLYYCSASNTWSSVATSVAPLYVTNANTLEQYNGSTGQAFNIYNVTGSNYERADLKWSGNEFSVGTTQGSAGTLRPLAILDNGTRYFMKFNAGSSNNVGIVDISNGPKIAGSTSPRIRIGGGGAFQDSSGNAAAIDHFDDVNPNNGSSMVYRGYYLRPTIEYGGTPAAGSAYEALRIAVIETPTLPVGPNYLIRASAGSAGTTDKFRVTNAGAATFASSVTGTAGTATYKAGGIVCQNLTNPTDAAVQNQWNVITCAIPAATMSTVGDKLVVEVPAVLGANTNAKEYQVWWSLATATCSGTNANLCDSGCTLLTSNTSSNGVAETGQAVVWKTGTATQKNTGRLFTSTSVQGNTTGSACTIDDTAATQIAAGWRNTAAAAASVSQASIDVMLFPK